MLIRSHSVEATETLGRLLSACLRPGNVLAFHGDLGAGKTVLSRGLARGLGVTEAVTSPTFTIVQEYPLPDGLFLYHLDMYRIPDDQSAIAFGIDEFLFNKHAYTLVEWPLRIPGLLGDKAFNLTLSHLDENTREIDIPAPLADNLQTALFPPELQIIK
jgi:tRNA threonylcarbamoyladenosine biosynthesis protein TsaE